MIKAKQKLVSFTEDSQEYNNVIEDMENGWFLINLVKNGNYYVGIMEQKTEDNDNNDIVFIPPRKKIKIAN